MLGLSENSLYLRDKYFVILEEHPIRISNKSLKKLLFIDLFWSGESSGEWWKSIKIVTENEMKTSQNIEKTWRIFHLESSFNPE